MAEGISGQSSQQPQAVNAGSQSGNSNVAFGREGFERWKAQETVANYFEAYDQANLALADDPSFDLDVPIPVSSGSLPSIPKVGLPGFNIAGEGLLQTGWGNYGGKYAGVGLDGKPIFAFGVVGETTGVRMTQAQKDAYDLAAYRAAVARGDVSTVTPIPSGSSVARPLSDAEAFFTFNPLGRFASGWAKGAYAIVHSPVDLVQGGAHLVQDAWGLSKEAMFGPERGVMGDLRPYQPKNSIVSSVMYRGGLATAGDVISSTVKGLPGVSTIDALYRRDWEAAGASGPGVALALVGGELTTSANSRVFQSGARQVINPNSIEAWDAADSAYDAIRMNNADIKTIAQNIGWPEARVAAIKDHVFYDEHLLDSGMRRFDADPDIVNAWSRLTNGDFVQSDIHLLQHERFESKFESIFKTNYRTAHDAAIRSGRTWTPE